MTLNYFHLTSAIEPNRAKCLNCTYTRPVRYLPFRVERSGSFVRWHTHSHTHSLLNAQNKPLRKLQGSRPSKFSPLVSWSFVMSNHQIRGISKVIWTVEASKAPDGVSRSSVTAGTALMVLMITRPMLHTTSRTGFQWAFTKTKEYIYIK